MIPENTDAAPEPILLLPDILAPEILYEVVDIGPLIPSHTGKESGHFDVELHLAQLTGLPETFSQQSSLRGARKTIQVPFLLLPHAGRGTLWQNRMKVGEVLCPMRRFDIFIEDQWFDTISGAEIFARHFTDRGQMLAAAVELPADPNLSNLFSVDFVETAFVHISNNGTEYYVPCDVLFKYCFYHSYLIASNILAGNFEGNRNKLYRPANSRWIGKDFQLDVRHLAPAVDERPIARLVCCKRGISAMQHVRSSLQNQIVSSKRAYMRAHFPFRGFCSIAIRGTEIPSATGRCFLVNRIVSALVRDPFDEVKAVRTEKDMDSKPPELGNPGNRWMPPIQKPPKVDPGARLTPDSKVEGKSSQKTARIAQSELDGSWLSAPCNKVLVKVPGLGIRTGRRSFEKPGPIGPKFSTALTGTNSSPDATPRAGQGPAGSYHVPSASPAAIGSVDNQIGARFSKLVHTLESRRDLTCELVVSPEELDAIAGKPSNSDSWLPIADGSGQTRQRHIYHILVNRRFKTSRSEKPCLVIDYERGLGEAAPHPSFVVFPDEEPDPKKWLELVAGELVIKRGKLNRLQINFHLVRDQNNADWYGHGWGQGSDMHYAYKVATAIRRFWSEARPNEIQSKGLPEETEGREGG